MSHSLFALSSPTKLALSIQQLHIPFFPSHMSAIIPTQQTRNQVMKYCISIIFCIMIEIIKLHSLSPPMLALFSKDIKFHSPTITTIPSSMALNKLLRSIGGGYMHEIARTLISILNEQKTQLSKQLIKQKHYRASINYVKAVHDSY